MRATAGQGQVHIRVLPWHPAGPLLQFPAHAYGPLKLKIKFPVKVAPETLLGTGMDYDLGLVHDGSVTFSLQG